MYGDDEMIIMQIENMIADMTLQNIKQPMLNEDNDHVIIDIIFQVYENEILY